MAGLMASLVRPWMTAALLCMAIGTSGDGMAQTAPKAGAPIEFTISNQFCFRGPGIEPYIQQAIAQRRRAAASGDAGELRSFFVAVPGRTWRGLTVTGVGLHYESTSVYFREPVAQVRRALRKAGVRVDPNGVIPITNEEAVEVQSLAPTNATSRRYGASGVTCGV